MKVRVLWENGIAYPLPMDNSSDINNYGDVVEVPELLWESWEEHVAQSRRWNRIWKDLTPTFLTE